MPHDLHNTIALLTHTPAALDALLRGLPESWTLRNEGADTWTARDVVAHLVYNERHNWLPRARVILESGETQGFESLDRSGHVAESQGLALERLLDEFSRLRSDNLAVLRGLNLDEDDLERRGRHPAFGTVTLSQLLATWAAHDLTHLHQLSRILAYQCQEIVGPWRAYLGVMKCAGHSSP
jgi:hypothetical protein